jgi:hypothetical protein
MRKAPIGASNCTMIESNTIGMKTSSRRRMLTPEPPSRRTSQYARFLFRRDFLLNQPFFEVRYFRRALDRGDGAVPRDQQRARDLALPGRVDLESEAFDKSVTESQFSADPSPAFSSIARAAPGRLGTRSALIITTSSSE